jgi:radical SAM protein with 4Fe4S-binding SPASM domain
MAEKLMKFDKESQEIIKNRIPQEMDFPKVILIDTISYCNLRCYMCPHKEMKRKPGIMSWDLYKKIIDEIAQNQPDAQIWITFFGEGMILKDLPEKIKYAEDKGLHNIILNSNGNLFRTDFSKRLIDSGLQGLYVGIDAFNPETHKKIRIGGDLEKVKNGVLEYQSLLKQYGKKDQKIVVQFVEMDLNAAELDDFVNFWHKEHGIECKIRPMVSWGGKVNAPNILMTTKDARLPCYWALNTINITDQGEVALCSGDLECEQSMGNVVSHTIREIWNTSLKEFRSMQRNGDWANLPERCRGCNDWQSGYAKYL